MKHEDLCTIIWS